MKWYEEVLIVLAHSTKAQAAIVCGIVFFVLTLVLGYFATSSFELHGLFAPLTVPIREIFEDRFVHLAFGTLGGFLLLALKSYKKDRKRLFGE